MKTDFSSTDEAEIIDVETIEIDGHKPEPAPQSKRYSSESKSARPFASFGNGTWQSAIPLVKSKNPLFWLLGIVLIILLLIFGSLALMLYVIFVVLRGIWRLFF